MTSRHLLLAALLLVPAVVQGQSLLVSRSTELTVFGYGGSLSTTFTQALDDAFGPNVTVTGAITPASLVGHTALLVDLRNFAEVLSASEQAAIQTFVNAGNRVFLVGENGGWPSWSASLLAPFGASYTATFTGGSVSTTLVHPLTAGVGTISTLSAGTISDFGPTGVPLFDAPYAGLFGTGRNALAIMDVNTCANGGWDLADNATFCTNIAEWLADAEPVDPDDPNPPSSTVPEPSTVVLTIAGLAGMLVVTRRRQRQG